MAGKSGKGSALAAVADSDLDLAADVEGLGRGSRCWSSSWGLRRVGRGPARRRGAGVVALAAAYDSGAVTKFRHIAPGRGQINGVTAVLMRLLNASGGMSIPYLRGILFLKDLPLGNCFPAIALRQLPSGNLSWAGNGQRLMPITRVEPGSGVVRVPFVLPATLMARNPANPTGLPRSTATTGLGSLRPPKPPPGNALRSRSSAPFTMSPCASAAQAFTM
jgi:hypothetical protein